MRFKSLHIVTLLLGFILSLLLPLMSSAQGDSQEWLIKSVQVLDIYSGEFSKPQDVLVQDGKIKLIAPNIQINKVIEISGKGQYLVPGFTEMHAHVPPSQINDAERDRLLFLFSAHGITTIRGMLGHPLHLKLRQMLANNEVRGPRLITSGPSFNGRSVFNTTAAIGRVGAQVEKGYDFIKVHPGLSHEEFSAMARKAKELKHPFAGHVTAETGVIQAAQMGQGTIDHLDGVMQELSIRSGNKVPSDVGFFGSAIVNNIDPEHIKSLASELAQTGVAIVPTESLMHGFLSPELPQKSAQIEAVRLMPEDTVKRWIATRKAMHESEGYSPEKAQRFLEYRQLFTQAFIKAGGTVLLGSDAPQVFNVPGDAIHYEMALMTQVGLTPLEVLQATSIKPAIYFGEEAEFGSISTGKSADFVLLGANPLDDINNTRNISGVMTRGTWLSKADIDQKMKMLRR